MRDRKQLQGLSGVWLCILTAPVLWLCLIASDWMSPGHISPRVLLQFHTHFTFLGAWLWWLCPLRCSGSSGAPERDSSGSQLHSSPHPAQVGCADPTVLSLRAAKALPKTARISLAESNMRWLLLQGFQSFSELQEHSSYPAPTFCEYGDSH